MKQIDIYTDGSCKGNPGPGGYAALLCYRGTKKEIAGYETETTNNKMELRGVIEALKALKEPCEVSLFSDSKYVCDAVSKGWVYKWKENAWMRNKKDKAQNVPLWEELLELLSVHQVTFSWVKGHSDHPENERCDALATAQAALAAQELQKERAIS